MILAIDPGPVESGYVLLKDGIPAKFQKCDNALLVDAIATRLLDADEMVIEKIASYGMAVGQEIFETVFWSGRFAQAFYAHLKPAWRIERKAVKINLCGTTKAKDSNIRQAIIDRFGGKDAAIGRKAAPGPLYGISKDCWSALAVALTYLDLQKAGRI